MLRFLALVFCAALSSSAFALKCQAPDADRHADQLVADGVDFMLAYGTVYTERYEAAKEDKLGHGEHRFTGVITDADTLIPADKVLFKSTHSCLAHWCAGNPFDAGEPGAQWMIFMRVQEAESDTPAVGSPQFDDFSELEDEGPNRTFARTFAIQATPCMSDVFPAPDKGFSAALRSAVRKQAQLQRERRRAVATRN